MPSNSRLRGPLFCRGGNVLGFAVAERPVFFWHFHQGDEDIFAAEFQACMQSVGDGFVEALLHFDGAAGAKRDLHEDAVVGAMNAEIIPVEEQLSLGVFGDDLEAVIFGDGEAVQQSLVDDLTNLGAIFRGLAGEKIDADEGHGFSLMFARNVFPRQGVSLAMNKKSHGPRRTRSITKAVGSVHSSFAFVYLRGLGGQSPQSDPLPFRLYRCGRDQYGAATAGCKQDCVRLLDSQTSSPRHRKSDPDMLLSKEYVGYLAREVTKKLIAGKAIETSAVPKVTERVHAALLDELTLEDRINDEVRVILEAYSEEMNKTGANYQEMFRKVKSELVRKYKAVL